MKRSILFFLIISSFYSLNTYAQLQDTISYSLGILIAQNLKDQGFDQIDQASFMQAFNDIDQGTAQMTTQEANSIMQEYHMAQQREKFADEEKAGQQFLAENAKREGVVTLPSGVQYEIITEGTGAKPSATDKVSTHYHGMLIDGKVFDSSVERGTPATFPVNGVIQGWQEVLQLMPVGSKWKVYIPYDKAYGSQGAGRDIPPYAALIFEIELLSIE